MTDRFVPLRAQIGDFQPAGGWFWGATHDIPNAVGRASGLNFPRPITVGGHYDPTASYYYVPPPIETVVKIVHGIQGHDPANTTYVVVLTAQGNVYAPVEMVSLRDFDGEISYDPSPGTFGHPAGVSDLVPGIPQGSFVDIDTSNFTSFALDSNGNLWAWDSDWLPLSGESGAQAVFGVPYSTTPFITLRNVAYFRAGAQYCIAQKTDFTWWAVGQGGDGADGLASINPDGTFYQGDATLWGPQVGLFWTEVPSLEALDTVKIATGSSFAGSTTLFLQRNGTVWACGTGPLGGGGGNSPPNMTGLNYATGLYQDLAYPTQVPGMTNIVDVAIAGYGEFALYLTAGASNTFFVEDTGQRTDNDPTLTPVLGPWQFPPGANFYSATQTAISAVDVNGRTYAVYVGPDPTNFASAVPDINFDPTSSPDGSVTTSAGVAVDPFGFYWVATSALVQADTVAEIVVNATVFGTGGTCYFVSGKQDGSTPPTPLIFPPGVACRDLLQGGGAVIGDDGRLYTLGITPTGEYDQAALDALNVISATIGYDPFFTIDGTKFDELLNLGYFNFPVSPFNPVDVNGNPDVAAGEPPPALARNRLRNVVQGGFSTFGFNVFALTSSGSPTPPPPFLGRAVPLIAFFSSGRSLRTWSHVIGPV